MTIKTIKKKKLSNYSMFSIAKKYCSSYRYVGTLRLYTITKKMVYYSMV